MISFELKVRKKILWPISLIVVAVCITGCMIYQPVFFAPDLDESIPKSSPEKLQQHVRTLSEKFHPRSYTHLENINKCADYIKQQFELTGEKVEIQPFDVRGYEYKNIIVKFNGNPQSTEWLVVGAHYDSYGDTPGADDNASGVAGLIELARLLGENPLPVNIEIVAYTLEEPPFFKSSNMGSYRHAQKMKVEKVNLQYALILEMIGRFSDEPDSQQYPSAFLKMFYPSKGNFVGIIGNTSACGLVKDMKVAAMKGSALPVKSINAPALIPGIDFSDHWSYWQFEFPGVMISDTAFYRNHDYHGAGDTWDKLDYESMANVVEMTYSILKNVN